jgi:hypothetical protein
MSLLDKVLEKRMVSQAGKKISLVVREAEVEPRLLKEVGGLLGSGSPAKVLKEAFLAASCMVAEPNKRLLESARFDEVQRVFDVIERGKSISRRGPGKTLKVSVLRWNLLILGEALTHSSIKGPTSTGEIANAVLKICRARLTQLFSGNGKEKGNGIA